MPRVCKADRRNQHRDPKLILLLSSLKHLYKLSRWFLAIEDE